jgi:hypothetical protein
MQTPTVHPSADIRLTIFGYASPTSGHTALAERLVTADELADGRFEHLLDALATANGWRVTHVYRRTPADAQAYEETLKLAAELGVEKATGTSRALLERFLTGEVTESLVFALGRAVREGGGHPVTEYAIKAAERDAYRVFWRARLGVLGIHALRCEAETWANRALDWTRT